MGPFHIDGTNLFNKKSKRTDWTKVGMHFKRIEFNKTLFESLKKNKNYHFRAHEHNTFFPLKWRKTVAKGKKLGKNRYFIKTIQRYVKQLWKYLVYGWKEKKNGFKSSICEKMTIFRGSFWCNGPDIFLTKVCLKKFRNQILRILFHDGDKLINPDNCKRKKTRKYLLKKCYDLLKKCNGPDVRPLQKQGKPLNWL